MLICNSSYLVLCPTSTENLEWYLLEVLPYNHCLYDNLNRFHFIVPLDIDEIIFPIMVVHMLLGNIFFNGLIYNLFVTSKTETMNSPIHEFKVL